MLLLWYSNECSSLVLGTVQSKSSQNYSILNLRFQFCEKIVWHSAHSDYVVVVSLCLLLHSNFQFFVKFIRVYIHLYIYLYYTVCMTNKIKQIWFLERFKLLWVYNNIDIIISLVQHYDHHLNHHIKDVMGWNRIFPLYTFF